jgi:drug/metabolite transporter (DMT)-like permease
MTVLSHSEHHQLKRGIVLILLAWLFFALSFLFVKITGPAASISSIILIRHLVSVILVLPWMIQHRKESFNISDPKLIGIRSLSFATTTVLSYLAVQMIPLADATLLISSAPLFVPFIIWIWLKKPIAHKLWPSILFGFLGIGLILNPDQKIFNLGALLALGAGITSGISFLAIRLITHKEKVYTLIFYACLIGAVTILPFALWNWRVDSLNTYLLILAMGACGTCGQWLLFKGLQKGKASLLAPFSYSTVIYSGIFDWLFFGNIPGTLRLIGILVVIASGIAIVIMTKPPKAPEENIP